MSPVEINERTDPIGPDPASDGRRASLKGFLAFPMTHYLELLDWTGRQLKVGKRGSIPAHLAPILQRLGIDVERWCDLVSNFGKLFKRAVGSRESLAKEAERRGQGYLHAPGLAFLSG